MDATPIARRVAAEAGIDLESAGGEQVRGKTNPARGRRSSDRGSDATGPGRGGRNGYAGQSSAPHTRIRQITAQRMAESAHTTAPVTLTTEADATELMALRQQLKQSYARRGLAVPSLNDIYLKLTAAALQEHPAINASWRDEGVLLHRDIHIAFAVDTEEGLLAPVLRDVSGKVAASGSRGVEGAD